MCLIHYYYIIYLYTITRRACDKLDKMTKWPWLMIILALISTVQWPNSIAQHTYDYKTYWEEYLWSQREHNYRAKRSSTLDREDSTVIITTSKNVETLKIEPRSNTKNTSVRTLSSSNVTKSLPKNENTINNSSIQPTSGLKFPQTKSSSSIVFPNSLNEKTQTVSANSFIPEQHVIEKCSMNGSFCIKVDNYPRQDLQNIFRTSKFMSTAFFGVDTVSEINDLETRISNTNLQPFCDSQEDVIFPEAGINLNNEWRYIVQDPNNENNNFKQGIRVEKCVNAGQPCKFSDNLPLGYTTTCVQKYIYKKLVAIKESKEVYYDNFKLPSCCACMYSQNPELLTRKGGDIENRRTLQNTPENLKKIKEVLKTKT